jgi:hypothetical protein
MRGSLRSGGIGLALVALTACGGGDGATKPTGAAMDAQPGAHPPRAKNDAPSIGGVTFVPEAPASREPVRAVVSATDPDGDAIQFGYQWRVGGRVMTATGDVLDLGPVAKGERIEVTVTASDGRAESAPFTARAAVGNRPPKVDEVAFEPSGQVSVGTAITAHPKGVDDDGDALEYRFRWLVNGDEVEEHGAVLATDRLRRGDQIAVEVVASDGDSESEPLRATSLQIVNAIPRIVSSPPSDLDDGVFRYRVQTQDADGDRALRFRLVKAPAGMEIDAVSGEIEWRPSLSASGTHGIEILVEDGQGGSDRQRFDLAISDDAAAAAPASAASAPNGDDAEASSAPAAKTAPARSARPKASAPADAATEDEESAAPPAAPAEPAAPGGDDAE